MKILLVNTYYYPEIYGGAEYSVKKLAEALKRYGHEVIVLATGNSEIIEQIEDVKIIRFKPSIPCRACEINKSTNKIKKINRKILEIYNPFNRSKLEQILDSVSPDVIHTNGLYDISPVIWRIAKIRRIAVIHTIRDYYLCCPKITYICKSNMDCSTLNIICEVYKKIHKNSTSFVDAVTAPSNIALSFHLQEGFFLNAKSVVIPNAIEFNKDSYYAESIIQDKKNNNRCRVLKFVYLGALSETKGVKWLIENFKLINMEEFRAELWIAGKGDLIEYVKENEDNNLHFVGFLDENGVDELLRKMDVLICPSIWNEPFGRVVLDAYKHSIPVISSDCGALVDLVKDKITGFIVPTDNTCGLRDAMVKYMKNQKMIDEHRANIEKELYNYTIEKQVCSFAEIYKLAKEQQKS